MNAAFGWSRRGRWIVLAAAGIALARALTACGGCDTATGICEDLDDMGFVRMLVLDQEGAPVPNVNSCASITNNGFVCGFTQSDSVTEHPLPVGMRRTWVEPPEGYVQGSDRLEQMVEVVKDQTTAGGVQAGARVTSLVSGRTAVDVEGLASDVAGFVGRQERT